MIRLLVTLVFTTFSALAMEVNLRIRSDADKIVIIVDHQEESFPKLHFEPESGVLKVSFYKGVTSIKLSDDASKLIGVSKFALGQKNLDLVLKRRFLNCKLFSGKLSSSIELRGERQNKATILIPYSCQPACIFKRHDELLIALAGSSKPKITGSFKSRILPSKEGLIVAYKIGNLTCNHAEQNSKGDLALHLADFASPAPQIEQLCCRRINDGYHWPINGPYKVLTFSIGAEQIHAIACASSMQKEMAFEGFRALQSICGLAFVDQGCQIFQHSDGVSVQITDGFKPDLELPWHSDGTFLEQKKHLEKSIVSSPTTEEAYLCTARLAKLHFSRGHYHEAAQLIESMKCYPAFENDLNLQFALAAASYFAGHIQDAKAALSAMEKKSCSRTLTKELAMLSAFVNESANLAQTFLNSDLPSDCHEDVYWAMAFKVMSKAAAEHNLFILESVLQKVRTPNSVFAKQGLQYYEGEFLMQMGKLKEALEKLEPLAAKAIDPSIKLLSILAVTKAQLADQAINNEEAIKILENARITNADSSVTNKVTLELADLHERAEDPIGALRALRRYRLDQDNETEMASRTASLYKKAFSKDGIMDRYTPLQAVAAFNEFKHLLPSGPTGDHIVFLIAQKLVFMDLLSQAEEVLMHQIGNRLSGRAKSAASNCLACVLVLNGKLQDALRVLDKASIEDSSLRESQLRSRLKSIVHAKLGSNDQAAAYLDGDTSLEALNLRKEILFNARKWQEYAALVTPSILSLTAEDKKNLPEWVARDSMRLALSYIMLNLRDRAAFLAERLKAVDKELAFIISELSSSSSTESYKKAAKYSAGGFHCTLKRYYEESYVEGCSELRRLRAD